MSRTSPRFIRSFRSLRLTAALAPAMLVQAALAGGSICEPRIPYTIPDLDQVRTGLPGGGSNHCVPTCTMDLFKYMTNHGYPGLAPGSGPWVGSQAVFNQMTTAIDLMGIYMNTVPSGEGAGTSGSNAVAGINQWVNDSGIAGDILVTMYGVSGNDAPELGDIALSMLLDRPISLSVGWYLTDPQILGQLNRDGGHCVAAARLPDFCTPNRKLSIRDPGNGGDASTQQLGTTETYSIQTQIVQLINDENNVYYTGPLERMLGYGSVSKPGYIDAFRSFTPKFGIAACNNPVNGLCVQVFSPNPGFTAAPNQTHLNPAGAILLDLDVHPDLMHTLVLSSNATGGGTNSLRVFENRQRADNGQLVSLPFNVRRVTTGNSWRRVYALASNGLSIVSAPLPNAPTPAPAPVIASQHQQIDAICFDHNKNQLVALAAAARRVIRLNPDTLAEVSNFPLPTGVVVGPDPRITICPVGSYLWLASGAPTAFGIENVGTSLAIAAVISSTPAAPCLGIDADDRGHVFTSVNGAVIEFARNSTGAWTRVLAGDFDAMPAAGGNFRVARSRSNISRAIHDQPEWTSAFLPDTFAPSIPDCVADFNLSGNATVQDLFDFLEAWFAGDLSADINENMSVTVQDIFEFLRAWFNGC